MLPVTRSMRPADRGIYWALATVLGAARLIPEFPSLGHLVHARTHSAAPAVLGSVLRPADRLAAQKQLAAGNIAAAECKVVDDRAVDEAIALQESVGLEVVTDGEMLRQSFQSQMTAAVSGFGEHNLDAFLW